MTPPKKKKTVKGAQHTLELEVRDLARLDDVVQMVLYAEVGRRDASERSGLDDGVGVRPAIAVLGASTAWGQHCLGPTLLVSRL